MNRWTAALAMVCALGLSACGGGGGSAGDGLYGDGTSSGGTTTTKVASDLLLKVSPDSSLQNSFSNSVTVTVTALDANRVAMSAVPVTLSVNNGGVITSSATVTGTNGTLTGTLTIGSDQTARTLTVTATSGTVVAVKSVQVVGSKLSASGLVTTVSTGSTNTVTYLLTDNAGIKMSGYPITVTAGTTTRTGVTNPDGEYVFSYVAPNTSGSIVVSASAGGTSDTQTVTVAGSATVPAATTDVLSPSVSVSPSVLPVNTVGSLTNKAEVRALFLGANNAPVKNVRVWFDLGGDANSIGGTLASTADGKLLYSDANGVARTTYASGTRSSPKDGVTVRACWSKQDFDISTCPNEALATLTVSSESLSISIGTNGKLELGSSGGTYVQRFVVSVVDAAGRAKSGVEIAPSIDLLKYYKGYWVPGTTSWVQVGEGSRTVAADGSVGPVVSGIVACDNEDLNRNGVVESSLAPLAVAPTAISWPTTTTDAQRAAELARVQGINEDQNGSLNLSPGRPALDPRKADIVVSAANSTYVTDASGIVVLKIEYAQNLGSWLRYNLLVSASGVAGTEGRANFEDDASVLASDVNNVSASPPFQLSPYGQQGSLVWARRNAQGQSALLCSNPY